MRDTSLAAHYEHSVSGAMQTQRDFIFNFLKEHGSRTREQLVEATGIPINSVCGRVHELKELGQVKDNRKVTTAYGRKAYLVEVA